MSNPTELLLKISADIKEMKEATASFDSMQGATGELATAMRGFGQAVSDAFSGLKAMAAEERKLAAEKAADQAKLRAAAKQAADDARAAREKERAELKAQAELHNKAVDALRQIAAEERRAAEQARRLKDTTAQVAAEANRAKDSFSGLGGAIRGAFGSVMSGAGFGVGLMSVQGAISGISAAMKTVATNGVAFNSTLEDAKLSIAAVLKTFDSKGQYATLDSAFSDSKDLLEQLKAKAVETKASFIGMVEAYQGSAGAMMAAGIPLERQINLMVRMSQGMGALGIREMEMRQETTAIMMGMIDRNARLAKTLGITNADVANWKAAGTLADELEKRMAAIGEAGKLAQGNISYLTSNIKDAFDIASGAAGKELTEAFRELLKVVFEFVKSEQFVVLLRDISDALKAIVEAATGAVKWIREHVVLIRSIGEAAAYAVPLVLGLAAALKIYGLQSAGSIVGGIVQGITTAGPAIGTALSSVIGPAIIAAVGAALIIGWKNAKLTEIDESDARSGKSHDGLRADRKAINQASSIDGFNDSWDAANRNYVKAQMASRNSALPESERNLNKTLAGIYEGMLEKALQDRDKIIAENQAKAKQAAAEARTKVQDEKLGERRKNLIEGAEQNKSAVERAKFDGMDFAGKEKFLQGKISSLNGADDFNAVRAELMNSGGPTDQIELANATNSRLNEIRAQRMAYERQLADLREKQRKQDEAEVDAILNYNVEKARTVGSEQTLEALALKRTVLEDRMKELATDATATDSARAKLGMEILSVEKQITDEKEKQAKKTAETLAEEARKARERQANQRSSTLASIQGDRHMTADEKRTATRYLKEDELRSIDDDIASTTARRDSFERGSASYDAADKELTGLNTRKAELPIEIDQLKDTTWLDDLDARLVSMQDNFLKLGDAIGNVIGDMTESMSGSIEGLLNGTMTLGDAWNNLWQGVAQSAVKALSDMVAQWIMKHTIMAVVGNLFRVADVAGHTTAETAKTTATATGAGARIGLGMKEGFVSIFKAGAGAMEAMAKIPYVGPFLAIAALGAVVAAGVGLAGRIAKGFSKGGHTGDGDRDEPAGVVHKGEWVAPKWMVKHPKYAPMISELESIRNGNSGGRTGDAEEGYSFGGFVARLISPNGPWASTFTKHMTKLGAPRWLLEAGQHDSKNPLWTKAATRWMMDNGMKNDPNGVTGYQNINGEWVAVRGQTGLDANAAAAAGLSISRPSALDSMSMGQSAMSASATTSAEDAMVTGSNNVNVIFYNSRQEAEQYVNSSSGRTHLLDFMRTNAFQTVSA